MFYRLILILDCLHPGLIKKLTLIFNSFVNMLNKRKLLNEGK